MFHKEANVASWHARAIVVREGGGAEVLRLEEVPHPVPGEGQVLVCVEAAAVNHVDLTQRLVNEPVGRVPGLPAGVATRVTRCPWRTRCAGP
jgi:NADPH:quinone reductase-like Zn-dependent oxidoreductase